MGTSYPVTGLRYVRLLLFSGDVPNFYRVGFNASQFKDVLTFRYIRDFRVDVFHRCQGFALDLRESGVPVDVPPPFRMIGYYRRVAFFWSNYFVDKGRVSVGDCCVLFSQVRDAIVDGPIARFFRPLRYFGTAKDRWVVRVVIVMFTHFPRFCGEGVIT